MKNKQIKIFIIEDDKLQNRMMQEAITTQFKDVAISPFFSVESALEKINELPDFIIVDHFLEKLNGIESVPLFKKSAPKAKIIIISGQHKIKTFEDAIQFGAHAYFTKDGNSIKNVIEYLKKEIGLLRENWIKSIFKKFRNRIKKNSNKLIYILEDNLASSFSIEYVLKHDSLHRVSTFQNSVDFMTQVMTENPDVVILDYYLDEIISGKEILQSIKDYSKDIKVIIYSNQTDINVASELLKLGASHFLTKNHENLLKLKELVSSD